MREVWSDVEAAGAAVEGAVAVYVGMEILFPEHVAGGCDIMGFAPVLDYAEIVFGDGVGHKLPEVAAALNNLFAAPGYDGGDGKLDGVSKAGGKGFGEGAVPGQRRIDIAANVPSDKRGLVGEKSKDVFAELVTEMLRIFFVGDR
jgi:hypothetical protein